MDESQDTQQEKLVKRFFTPDNPARTFLVVVSLAVFLGIISGYLLTNRGSALKSQSLPIGSSPKTPQQDTRTFRDFAEGTVKKKPEPSDVSEYVEGTHLLERAGAVPVALTSSVVDLSKYEGKKVKVFGETQKAIKEGWLMDVGKVEEVK